MTPGQFQMQKLSSLNKIDRVLVLVLLALPTAASAHAGGLETAPLVGLAFGLAAGLVIGALPKKWREAAAGFLLVVALVPVVIQIVSDSGFPRDIMATLGWLSLGFAFLLVPGGLACFLGYLVANWFRFAIRFVARWRSKRDG